MDADCLIKLTKAGLKELVGKKNSIFIPEAVKREIVDAGKEKGCHDAFVVEKNIDANMITIVADSSSYLKGDQALIAHSQQENYDAVATDDAKLVRRLRLYGIPFILPGLILYQLHRDREIDGKRALSALHQLEEFISEDEFSTVRLLMEKKNESTINEDF